MAALDKNHDGILDAKDGLDASLIKMVGGNKGYINNADNTAYTMLTDRLAGNIPDGVLTPEEVNKSILPQRIRQQAAQEKAMGQTESAAKLEKQADELEKQYSKEIQGFVKGMKLEERDKALVMPKKSETPGNLEKLGLEPQPVKDNNEILKLLKQLIKLLMPNQSQESQAKPKEGNIFNFNGATNANFNFQGTSQEQNDFEQLPLDQ